MSSLLLSWHIADKCFYSLSLAAASKQYYDDLERLQKDLFTNYSTNIIPQKVKAIAVKVKFDIALNQIIDLVRLAVRRNCLNLIHTGFHLLASNAILRIVFQFFIYILIYFFVEEVCGFRNIVTVGH